MSDHTLDDWIVVVIQSKIHREHQLIANILFWLWLCGSSWFLLPYFNGATFLPGTQPVVFLIVAVVALIGLMIKLAAAFRRNFHRSGIDWEKHQATLTGKEIQRKFPSLPFAFAKTLLPTQTYTVNYLEISHTDAEGDLHQSAYAFQVDEWKDSRSALKFPKWLNLIPFSTAIFVFLGALLDRNYCQFYEKSSLHTMNSMIQGHGRALLHLFTGNLTFTDCYPLIFICGTIGYAFYLKYILRLAMETPTLSAVE